MRWGDKTPSYCTELDVLWHLFPGCRVIHLVRDGRDVALSLSKISWGSKHIPRVAEEWRWKTTLMRKMGTLLGEHYLEVRYEDLVLDTEATLRTICNFLGEPFHARMMAYQSSSEAEMPVGSIQWHQKSMQAPDPDKVFEWTSKMPLSDQAIFDEIAGPALDLFGYQRIVKHHLFITRLKKLHYAVIQRW
nr:sulfotransferase [Nitrosococcus halophilus]